MLSTIFIILMFAVIVDFFWLAIKLAWSVGKLILSFIVFPVAMILLAASGLITAALMIKARFRTSISLRTRCNV